MSDATVVDLASALDAELAAEISSPGAPPVMTKDGPKSPTRKMEAAASARKEATLRAVLRAQVDADYRADRLVRPLCLGVLRGRNSTPTQIRLATEILRGCDVAPEDEGVVSETIRAGLAIRTGADLAPMRGDASPSSVPTVAVTGAGSFAAEVHYRLLAAAPPALAARVFWRERERVEKIVAGDGVSESKEGVAARTAAISAVGAILSRAAALDALAAGAPEGADAIGARGAGAGLALALWRRVLAVAAGASRGATDAHPSVVAAAHNAVAVLVGPALDACHPTLPWVLAAVAREVEDFGEYSGAPEDGHFAPRGVATSADGDDPGGDTCPLLAGLRLEAALHVVTRAPAMAARAAALPPGLRPVARVAIVACACAALNAERENVFARLSARARASLPDPGATKLASNVAELGRLGLVAADVVGDALRRDADAATREFSATSESHLDPRDADVRERRGPPSVAVSHAYVAGTSLLALSGSLPRESQPLDWAAIGVGALISAWDDAPAINGDETTRAIPEFPQSSAIALESRRRRRAGRAVAPASKASIALAIVASLTTMPINQPLPAIRAVVNRARDGFASRPDVRVAAIARALATHAEMRTHPEAIVVMTPLGEIIGAHMDEDVRARRAAHRAETAAAEAERAASSAASAARGAGAFGFGASSKKKRAERDSATRALETLRAEAARATAEARAVTYREELVVCAVEAILALRPADEEARAGWRQVALEASATLRRAALWTNLDGRRAAPDAALRLIARLCAAAKVALSEGTRPDAQGTHSAAQRVVAALVQEASTASASGRLDDAGVAGVAWIACRYIDFPTKAAGERSAVGAPGGPLGRAVAGLVGGLLRGGAGRDAATGREAAARRREGTLAPAKSYVESSSASAASAAGLACAELLAARCPPLREGLARTLDAMLSSGGGANIGKAAECRAKNLRARLAAAAEGGAATPVPDDAPDIFPPASSPPPLALAHLLAGCGTARAAGAEGDFHLASAARRAAAAATRDARRAREGPASRLFPRPAASFASLTGASDPCRVEASHVARASSRIVTVTLRCRPPPASNAPTTAGAAAANLGGTLRVGLRGAARFADGAPCLVVELGAASAPPSSPRGGARVVSEGPGHVARHEGFGAEETTTVTFDVAVDAFDRVDVRPVVCFDGDDVVMRCAPYAIPLVDLLVPSPMSPSAFDALWNILPASAETSARATRPGADRDAVARVVSAMGGASDPWPGTGDGNVAARDERVSFERHTPFAHCGGYPTGALRGACERFAAEAWNGEPVLCVVFAAGRGVRLEHRAWLAATTAPLAENPREWVAAVAGDALGSLDAEDAEDGALFAPTKEPGRTGRAEDARVRDAALRQWRAMAA